MSKFTHEQVALYLKEIVVKVLGYNTVDTIQLTQTFNDDLNASSLDLVEIIIEVENVFDIDIPDDRAEKIKTVGDAVDAIMERV